MQFDDLQSLGSSRSNIFSTHSTPATYDYTILNDIDANMLEVQNKFELAEAALKTENKEEFIGCFQSYREMVILHQKLVSSALYVPLRPKLLDSNKLEEFKRFETKTLMLNQVIARFFKKYKESVEIDSVDFKKSFHRLEQLIVARGKQEKAYLYSMVLRLL